MSMLILFVIFLFFSALGVPIYAGLGISSILYLTFTDPGLMAMIPQRIWAGVNTYILIALPLFILAGELMNTGGITKRVVNFSLQLVRPFRGGLGEVTVVASMIMAGVSGSSVADTSAIGSVMIPAMEKKGFDKKFATALVALASTMGMIIPPSIPMVTYSMISGISIGSLFLAGVVPGFLIGLFQLIVVQIYKRKFGIHILEKESRRQITGKKEIMEGLLAFIMPLFIVGSISFGIATASESAGIAVLYAFIVGCFIFRELKFKDVPASLRRTAISTASIMVIIGFSMIFGWIIAMERVPESISSFLLSMNISKFWILLFLDIFILFLGTFLDVTPILILTTPIMLPILQPFGINALHFGTILIIGTAIGLVTPPLGMCLNAANKISKVGIMEMFKTALPLLACDLIVLILVTFIPEVSLFVPSLVMK
jgi:tripartite ATP-independent transporter DctM subunit